MPKQLQASPSDAWVAYPGPRLPSPGLHFQPLRGGEGGGDTRPPFPGLPGRDPEAGGSSPQMHSH